MRACSPLVVEVLTETIADPSTVAALDYYLDHLPGIVSIWHCAGVR